MISIVIPLYNKEKYVLATLQSVFDQTYQNFEVLVVNDGSTDNGLELVKSIKDSRIQIIEHAKNKGLSAARNTGISMAKGEVISLIDADDTWKSTYLEEIMKLVKSFPKASLFGTCYQEVYSNQNVRDCTILISTKLKNQQFYIANFFESSLGMPVICPSSFSFKKNIFQTIELFNESIDFAEDVDFYIRSNLAFKMAYSYKALVNVKMDIQEQMTSQPLGRKILPNLNSYEKENRNNYSLIKYLNFKRYIFAMKYKWDKNKKGMKLMLDSMDRSHLTIKQKILISMPFSLFWLIRSFKLRLLRIGIRWTTF
jgi:glycosyltransferase involved in cell wall biosynthesis